MAARGFCVKIEFDLHAVTCPGVWLCPNGSVALRINTLNSHIESHKTTPIFPLSLNDKFLFKKIFTGVCTLTELQFSLENEFIYAELIQWPTLGCKGVILATFETNLVDLLYPAPCFKGLLAGADVDLLMEPSKYFPGILAPKIEVSTRTIIEEVVGICELDIASTHIVNPKLINSKGRPCVHRKHPSEGIIRQRKVCHSHGRPKSTLSHCQHHLRKNHHICVSETCSGNQRVPKHVDQCYQKSKIGLKSYSPLPSRRVIESCTSKNRYHDFDDCPVCLRYQNLFSKGSRQNLLDKIDIENRKEATYGACDVSNCPEHASSIRESASSILQSKIRSLKSRPR